MTLTLLVALACCVLAWRLSGAPGIAYLLYFLAFLPFLTLDPEAGGAESVADFARGGSGIKAALRALTSIGFVVLLVRRRGWIARLAAAPNWPVLLFLVWAAASLVRAPAPMMAAVRLGELTMFFLAGLCLHTEVDRHHDPKDVLRWRCAALVPICAMVILSALLRPELLAFHVGPGGLRLGHRFLEANVLGFTACALSLWTTYALREPRESHELREFREPGAAGRSGFAARAGLWLLFATALVLLFFARSRTAMITWVLGQSMLWLTFGRRDLKRQLAALAIVAAVGAGLTLGFDLVAEWMLRGGSVTDLTNATGRTDLWAALVREEFTRSPIFGAGYLAIGSGGQFQYEGRLWSNAHNTYVFALVSLGLPGLLLLLSVSWVPILGCLRGAFGGDRLDHAWMLLLALQVTIVVTGLTGFGVCGHPNLVMLFSFALYPYCAQRALLPAKSAGVRVRRAGLCTLSSL